MVQRFSRSVGRGRQCVARCTNDEHKCWMLHVHVSYAAHPMGGMHVVTGIRHMPACKGCSNASAQARCASTQVAGLLVRKAHM